MSISIEEVDRIAKLARLSFTDFEKQKLQAELSRILDYVDQLKQVKDQVSSAEAFSEGGEDPDSVNLMRDDIAEELIVPSELLGLSPNREGDFYKVKSVLE